ncbi:cytochrome b/b6 domain-containing protein [Novosphingobium taihuense]|uniref:Cytochrome b n=1 Tax=Novosphingobium taihuense TaxID=260085 RepID=A0A7W7ETD8_9SPHN|nr:cytochrome b/b6 domain-containing protein [Novosphingobium taihuense]MBB4612766.1 cytochrome b [Novosphingobium taihuense]TWH80322.1 cytochrome b [Novosphingobium taihuense]
MTEIASAPTPAHRPARRWDPVVKLTHWSVVIAVIANALFTEEGSGTHVWIGYALAAILVLRLLWGLIGPAEARFTAFPPSIGRALAHLRDIRSGRHVEHRSHNPLGALMVYAIWSCLGAVIASGIAMAGLPGQARNERSDTAVSASTEIERGEDADEGDEGGEEEGALGEIHEVAVNLLYLLIALHVAGVVFETRRSGREVVLAMLPGQR